MAIKKVCVSLVLIYTSIAQLVFESTQKYTTVTGTTHSLDHNWQRKQNQSSSTTCVCVPYNNCLYKETINEKGVNLIDVRLGESDASSEMECPDPTNVCCIVSDIKSVKRSLKLPTNKQKTTFPGMVYIYKKEKLQEKVQNSFKCAGSLINEKVILTSAHCIFEIENLFVPDLRVHTGNWDIKAEEEKFLRDFEVEWIFTHPKYNNYLAYDYALVVLRTPVIFIGMDQIVNLLEVNGIIDPRSCYIAASNLASYSDVSGTLNAILLPTLSIDECQEKQKNDIFETDIHSHNSLICAGGTRGHDVCKVPEGSPFVCPEKSSSRYIQAGVIVHDMNCNDNNLTTYGNVTLARPWIDYILMNKLGIKSNSQVPSKQLSKFHTEQQAKMDKKLYKIFKDFE